MLTPERIADIAAELRNTEGCNDMTLARAIEAEVRKQYEALIRQMLEAFKTDRLEIEDWPEASRAAIAAAKARLGDTNG